MIVNIQTYISLAAFTFFVTVSWRRGLSVCIGVFPQPLVHSLGRKCARVSRTLLQPRLEESLWLRAITNCTAEVATSCGSGDLEGMKPRHKESRSQAAAVRFRFTEESTMLHRGLRATGRLHLARF